MTLIIDGNVLLMTSVMVWRKNRNISISYFVLLQIFKYIKLFKPDKIYLATDAGGSWRKAVYPEYKANRKDFRASFPDINWNDVFEEYGILLNNIQSFTPMKVVHIKNIEGDDVISYVCRYEQDPITIVSKDKDLKQLLVLPHVSLYLVKPKNKSTLLEKDNDDTLDDKIKSGDKSDNIPKAKTLPEIIRNEILIDLFNLPKTLELTIKNHIDSIQKSEEDGTFLKIYPFKFLTKHYSILKKNISQKVYNNLLKDFEKNKEG